MKTPIVLAAVASLGLSVPAQAAPHWQPARAVQAEIRTDIAGLNAQIARAARARAISPREAASLDSQADRLRGLFATYSRNGLDRAEVRTLERGVNAIRRNLRLEIRDWDRARG